MGYTQRLARRVHRYAPEDRAALLAFQREMFGDAARQVRDDHFRWLFEANPHRPDGAPQLWLLEKDGVVLGQQAGIPVALKVLDQELEASWAVDLMVRPEWRMRGAGAVLSAAQTAASDVVMASGISDPAYRAFLQAGWTDMGKLPFFFRPLDACAMLTSRSAPKWARQLAHFAPEAAVGGSAWVAAHVLEAFTGGHLREVPAFDARVDGLWREASPDYPVLARRDARTLGWRFDQSPERARYRRLYLERHGHLLGYAVTRMDTWHDAPVGRIVDHLSAMKWTAALFAEVVESLHRQGAVAVFYEGLDVAAERALRALGFLPGPPATRFMFQTRTVRPARRMWMADRRHWLVTAADADRDFG